MRLAFTLLLSLSLASCGPTIRRDMSQEEAKSALVMFMDRGAHGCTDAALLDLRGALASYSLHMDAAGRTWPHPHSYRLSPKVRGEKIDLRALDDTDLVALYAVRDGLAKTSDFAPLARETINTTWDYHTPKLDRKPFGAYSERVRGATCPAFVAAARARMAAERAMVQRDLTRSGRGVGINEKWRKVTETECALTEALAAAGGDAGPCRDRSVLTTAR